MTWKYHQPPRPLICPQCGETMPWRDKHGDLNEPVMQAHVQEHEAYRAEELRVIRLLDECDRRNWLL